LTGVARADDDPSTALYQRACAACHDAPSDARTPSRAALERLDPTAILAALEGGVMRTQAAALSGRERRALALYLGGRHEMAVAPSQGRCTEGSAKFDPQAGPLWLGFGGSATSARFQQDAQTRALLSPARAGRLELGWSFGYPGASVANGALTAAGG